MRVVVRVRPFTFEESRQLQDENTQVIQLSGKVKHINKLLVCRGPNITCTREDLKAVGNPLQRTNFTFDRVLDQTTDQADAFDATIQPLVPKLLDGSSATVFAYGATGCGKTFTMFGRESGIVNQTIALLLKINEPGFSVCMSYLEIYNEQLRDLLSPNRKSFSTNNTRRDIAQYCSYRLLSEAHFMQLLHQGASKRKVSAHSANNSSSRSHAVLKFTLKLPRGKQATLTFVNLACSERAPNTQINKSSMALGSCINALAQRRKFVPYRDSTLTWVLQPSLSGNSLMVMVACMSPSNMHSLETLNTLKYAKTARTIRGPQKIAAAPPSSRHQLTGELASCERKISELTKAKKLLESQKSASEARNSALTATIELMETVYDQRIQCWYEAEPLVDIKMDLMGLSLEYGQFVKEKIRILVERLQRMTPPRTKRPKWRHSPSRKQLGWSPRLEKFSEALQRAAEDYAEFDEF